MAQLSRRYLRPDILKKILDIFISSFSRIKDEQMTQKFFEEFLTSTERLMLAKRIVCLYLLYKKISPKQISDLIKVSTGTTARYKILLEKNTIIQEIFSEILVSEKLRKFIDVFLNEYLTSPPTLRGLLKKSPDEQTSYEKRKDIPF